jgi:uncharacterized coiled-coil DUF342 family protein
MTPERLNAKYDELLAFIERISRERNEARAEVDALAARVRALEDFVRDMTPALLGIAGRDHDKMRARIAALLAGDGRATEPETGGGG